MTTSLLLSLLCIAPIVALAAAWTRASRGGVLRRRAVAVAAMGAHDLDDVLTYTRDCSQAACLVLSRRRHADPAFLRRVLAEAVTQVDSIQRATRLRTALGRRWRARVRRLPSWPDVLLWLSGVVDADVVARLILWRGRRGIGDLETMTKRALRRFSSAMRDADEAPFVTLFADELLRMGLLEPQDLTAPLGAPEGAGAIATSRIRA
jgi:hypothetical protein